MCLYNTKHRLKKTRFLQDLENYAKNNFDLRLFLINIKKEVAYSCPEIDEVGILDFLTILKKHLEISIHKDDKGILKIIRDYKLNEILE